MTGLSVRLGLEVLDARNAPSNLVATTDLLDQPANAGWMPAYVAATPPADPLTPPGLPDPPPPPAPVNMKPVIKDFKWETNAGWICAVTGRVEDENPVGLSVFINGVPTPFRDKIEITNADGEFRLEVQIQQYRDTGDIWAHTVDTQGLQSDTVEDTVWCG